MAQQRAPGRPRSQRARRAVLAATAALLREVGYDRLAIDAIAARAGVSRQTIYRWWPSRADIVAETVRDRAEGLVAAPPVGTGDLHGELRTWLAQVVRQLQDEDAVALVRALVAAAAADPVDAERLHAGLTGPAHDGVLARLQEGVARGQVRPDADLAAVVDALFGSVLYLALIGEPVTPDRADRILDLLLDGIRPPSAGPPGERESGPPAESGPGRPGEKGSGP
ncbi:TetR/AcrR family transcriptional regulator [Georgenia sp. TF02-10]|uniref:TetR/AcrR family transcriptional regulator n=1 Tax=Georgenia sp. TF02-10 TaxID=2917725 RepID=UPI001FA6B569|nr:TetR/AcrR family transcriptional regulator [Georgenia sp. TF02-10]UNX56236.1 TetR/AcrR family transcriptional regulator [Georgenia sp. TF02-10]